MAAQVPPPPPIPGLPIPLEEVLASGQSVLEELDLWQCWKPSAWLRWGLELTHFYTGLPWWATISVCAFFSFLFIFFKYGSMCARDQVTNWKKKIKK